MITKDEIPSFRETYRVLVRADDFMYLLPHPALRDWISNYTITFPNKDTISDNYTVIPHGSATLVFSCDRNGISSNLFGPATKPYMVGSHANHFDMLFIIEFQPAGLYAYTGIQQKELTDHIIPFELIDSMLCRLIAELLENAGSIHELITGLDRLLLSNLHTTYPSELNQATHMIIESAGNISARELSGAITASGI